MRNSPTKPFRNGSPIEEKVVMKKTIAKRGAMAAMPPYSAILRVWRRS
jgi:hypothetical protein